MLVTAPSDLVILSALTLNRMFCTEGGGLVGRWRPRAAPSHREGHATPGWETPLGGRRARAGPPATGWASRVKGLGPLTIDLLRTFAMYRSGNQGAPVQSPPHAGVTPTRQLAPLERYAGISVIVIPR